MTQFKLIPNTNQSKIELSKLVNYCSQAKNKLESKLNLNIDKIFIIGNKIKIGEMTINSWESVEFSVIIQKDLEFLLKENELVIDEFGDLLYDSSFENLFGFSINYITTQDEDGDFQDELNISVEFPEINPSAKLKKLFIITIYEYFTQENIIGEIENFLQEETKTLLTKSKLF